MRELDQLKVEVDRLTSGGRPDTPAVVERSVEILNLQEQLELCAPVLTQGNATRNLSESHTEHSNQARSVFLWFMHSLDNCTRQLLHAPAVKYDSHSSRRRRAMRRQLY